MVELSGRKVWGCGDKTYGDSNWKEKIQLLLKNQNGVIVSGRYGGGNLNYHYNIKGFPFSLMNKDEFLKKLDTINIDFFDSVYLYDAFENQKAIWEKNKAISESTRYIFVSHTATDCELF